MLATRKSPAHMHRRASQGSHDLQAVPRPSSHETLSSQNTRHPSKAPFDSIIAHRCLVIIIIIIIIVIIVIISASCRQLSGPSLSKDPAPALNAVHPFTLPESYARDSGPWPTVGISSAQSVDRTSDVLSTLEDKVRRYWIDSADDLRRSPSDIRFQLRFTSSYSERLFAARKIIAVTSYSTSLQKVVHPGELLTITSALPRKDIQMQKDSHSQKAFRS